MNIALLALVAVTYCNFTLSMIYAGILFVSYVYFKYPSTSIETDDQNIPGHVPSSNLP